MAAAAAMAVAYAVRSTVLQKSNASRPPMPFHSAFAAASGGGSSTGSTTLIHTATYHSAIRPMTP